MPSKGLKSLVNLEEEALALASIKTVTNASDMKKTKKLLTTKELSTSSSSSSTSAAAAAAETTATTTTSQTTNMKMTKTKEKIVKYKKSKSTTIENVSMEEKTEILAEEQQQQKIKEGQQIISTKVENVSSEKYVMDKLPKNISKISSSTSTLTSSATSSATSTVSTSTATSSATSQSNNCQVSTENFQEDIENVAATVTNDKLIKMKMATGKKSLKMKSTKKHELMKQQQQQQQQQEQGELMTTQQQQQQQNSQREQTICKKCNKPVYKMEEVKAEKQIFHKNCFRCNQCDKQLKVDNYQSHEGILYCIVHFKLLFAPKFVEDDKPQMPQKPELIIRENQPAELPPDVVRASEKPNLGLEELHQLNLRSRFQLFEKDHNNNNSEEVNKPDGNVTIKRSATILAKMAKLNQQKHDEHRHDHHDGQEDEEHDKQNSDDDNSDDNLMMMSDEKLRQMQREQPLGLGEAMNDIRTRFENGPGLLKEERREERKQEIQNIRSRLFMGKQARIKEMYQQAVAQSTQSGNKSSNAKQLDIQIEIDAQRLKEKFERGEINNNNNTNNDDDNDDTDTMNNNNSDVQKHERKSNTLAQEAEVFEYGISKASRSIFMEIDANVKATNQLSTQLHSPKKFSNSTTNIMNYYKTNSGEQENMQQKSSEIIKCNENTEDIVIKTSEISEKFKFFEKYQPIEEKRREFRITPPRDGVVKMPSPEQEEDLKEAERGTSNELGEGNIKTKETSPGLLRSNTTTIMLTKFRQLEKQNYKLSQRHHNNNYNNYDDYDDDDNDDDGDDSDDYVYEPKPLKRFTPPPEGEKQYYTNQESDYDDDGNNENDDDANGANDGNDKDDEALREARAAARAKQLRMKFEKWQTNEMSHESHDGSIDVYSTQVSDDTTIESAKVLRERFENMKNTEVQQYTSRPRYQVKRFV